MQMCIKKLSAIVFFCIGCIPYVCHAGRSIEIVDLRLPWKHQFQFAGYYAALEKGYYAKAGLNVIIHEGTPSSVMPQVLAG
jgi:ABC-type nitrate/sulfonate/bicarbonate transport system substrate-binding protein